MDSASTPIQSTPLLISQNVLTGILETGAGSGFQAKDAPDGSADETSSRLPAMPSSPRATQSDLYARSAAPAYSDISWDTATHQERMNQIERMHSRINHITSSSTRERAFAASDEVTVLRAYVAQLETQLYGRNDELPPEY